MTLYVFPNNEVAVESSDVVIIRAVAEHDLDTRTGELLSSIPPGSLTRIETRSNGAFWVSEPWSKVVEALAAHLERNGRRGLIKASE